MKKEFIYKEKISSLKTGLLFIGLMILFMLLFIWRVIYFRMDGLCIVFLVIFCMFLFYSINYRVLNILLSSDELFLKFGVFRWVIPTDNIESVSLDDIPPFKRNGGAGIHFMTVHGRYRASFNFLEYPRVIITFKKKVGLVRDISFSTTQPDPLIRLIEENISNNQRR